MKISEKELEDFLFKNLNEKKFEKLKSIGFDVNELEDMYFYQQTNLGNYGRSDIIGLNLVLDNYGDKKGYANSVVIEIKEGHIDEKTLVQALRYRGALSSSLSLFNHFNKIILIGSSVCESFEKTLNLLDIDVSVFTYELSLSGISFNCNSIYEIEDERIYDESLIPVNGSKIESIIEDLERISVESDLNIYNS